VKKIISILLIMLLLLSAVGCTQTPAGDDIPAQSDNNEESEENLNEYGLPVEVTPKPKKVTVTDSAGRKVTTSKNNGDIVSLCKEATSLLISLEVEKRLTGVEHTACENELFKLAFPEIDTVEKVTDQNGVLTDKIIGQKPGLVVLCENDIELIKKFEDANIVCAVVALDDIESIKSSIELVGKLVNSNDKALKLKSYYESALSRLKVMTLTHNPSTVAVYNDNSFIRSMLSNINCNIDSSSQKIIASLDEGAPDNAITVPNGISRWDVPSTELILGIYWFAYKLYPGLFTNTELAQVALNFYADFYNIKLTEDQVGISVKPNQTLTDFDVE